MDKKSVPIGQAAEFLGVSVDTVRRWDEKGVLHSERPDGKNRYFTLAEIEKVKYSQPLTISEAAQKLEISEATLRRLEDKDLIKPDRSAGGERLYTLNCLEDFIKSDYYLRRNEIESKILSAPETESADHEDYVKDINSLREQHRVLNCQIEDHKKKIHRLNIFRKVFYYSGVSLFTALVMLVAIFTVLFLLYPNGTTRWFGYRSLALAANGSTADSADLNNGQVLGATYQAPDYGEPNFLSKLLQPIGGLSLEVVKRVNYGTYQQIAPNQPIKDVNDVFAINSSADIEAKYNFTFPSTAYIKIPDKDLIPNLNADFLRGKVPGDSAGNIVVYDQSGQIPADKVGQISKNDSVIGSAIVLGAGSGLQGNNGLSLNTGCGTNQILKWSGNSWICANDSSGAEASFFSAASPLAYDSSSGTFNFQYDTNNLAINSANQLTTIQGISTASSPTFAGLRVGSLNGIMTATDGTVSTTADNSANWDTAFTHTTLTNNPHNVTSTQVLPSQAGQNGKILGTNGVTVSWVPDAAGISWGAIAGNLADQLDLNAALNGKVGANGAIVGGTKTKITYDTKGLVTAGADATTADIADSLNRRYVTDAQLIIIGNTSGTNTGDETTLTIKTKLGTASGISDGYLTSGDWTIFSNKQSALTIGSVTAGSTKISLGGTPANSVIGAGFSVDVNQANIDHNSLQNYDANRHFLQTDITNVSAGLATGLMKVTNGTGAISSITDSSTNWDAGYTNRLTSASGTAPLTLTLLANALTGSIADSAADGATKGAATFTAADFDSLAGVISIDYVNSQIARKTDKLSAFASTTSLELAGVIPDETGSGVLVFAASPSLTTPNIGVATATSIVIGANTLDTTEWAYLDGLDQAISKASSPTFAGLALGSGSITMTGSIGTTGSRLAKGWFTDLEVTNAIAGSITGSSGTVVTNANLTGPITSVGNATSIASQTGTGTKFVVDNTPTLITPILGVAAGTSFTIGANTLDTNEWAFLDGQNQAVKTTSAVTHANITDSGLTSGRVTYASTNGLLVDSSTFTYNRTQLGLTTTGSTGGLMIGGDAPWYRTAAATLGGAVKISITPTVTNATLAGFSSSTVSTITSGGSYGGNAVYGGVNNIISAGITNTGTTTIFSGANLRSGSAGGNDSGTLTGLVGNSVIVGHNNTDLYSNPHTTTIYGANFTPYIKRGIITNYYGLLLSTPSVIPTPSAWASGTAYAINTIVAPTVANGYYYIAQNAGTSGGSEPSPWSTTENGTTVDNDITWFTLIIPAITNEYGVYQQSAAAFNQFMGNMGIGTSTKTSRLLVAGDMSGASWGGSGKRFRLATGTYTDTSGSGTVASIVSDNIAAVTLAASNAVTYTNAATLYINAAPIAGTNVTITNPWTIWVAGGNSRFDGSLMVGTTSATLTPYSAFDVAGTTGGISTLTRNDTSVAAGDVIGGIQGRTIDTQTTTNPIAAAIEFRARNTIASDINPGDIFFRTTSDSAGAALTDRYLLNEKGLINTNSTPISINTSTFSLNPKVLSFDGNADYITWAAGQVTELTSVANFSFSCWFNPSSYASTSKYLLYSQVDGSNRIIFLYDQSTDLLRIEIDNGSTPNYGYINNFSTLYPVNKWYYLAVAYDGSGVANADKLKVYLNGTLQSLSFLGTIPTTTPNLSSAAFVLSLTNTSAWNGYLRRAAIYSTTIDQTAVTSLFQGTNVTTNQVHYWMLNEGYGTTANDTGSNVKNGAIGSATWVDTNQIGIGTGFGTAALNFGVSTASDQGISWGNDTFMYRGGTGTVNFSTVKDTDLAFNFIGTTNSGVLNWMEDEDSFKFGDKVGINIDATAWLTLPAGSATAGTAPIKFTSGPLLSSAEAGAVEFLTDKFYATVSTGSVRKELALSEGLTSGRITFATTNGRLTDASTLTYDGSYLQANGYKSADGTAGVSVACDANKGIKSVTVKDGLMTAATCTTNDLTDMAENYGTDDTTIESGDVVAASLSKDATEVTTTNGPASKAYIEKASSANAGATIGIVSVNPEIKLGENLFSESENPRAVALSGRVKVKVTNENGAIKKGDLITVSGEAGTASKATQESEVTIGTALEDFNAVNGKIIVFVNISHKLGTANLGKLAALGAVKADTLTVEGEAIFKGIIKGNEKFAGRVKFLAGQTQVRVDKSWESAPQSLTLTPSFNAKSWVTEIDKTGFMINVDVAPTTDGDVSWFAIF